MAQTLTHKNYKIVPEGEGEATAWVFTAKDKPMQKVSFNFPELKPNEIRLKVSYAGLCHSDLHTVRAEWGEVGYPIAPGHEITGVVEKVGSEVKDFKVGDTAGFGCQRAACGKCESCNKGFEQLCDDNSITHKFTYDDMYWGGYATHVQQPGDFFFNVPKDLPEEKVPPLFCAGVTTYAPIARFAKPGDNVAVIGIGGLGHMGVQYLKAWGCKVTAFSGSKNKEEFIKKLGAERVVVSSPETLKEEAGKFDFVLSTLPIAEGFTDYVALTKKFGVYCNVGAPASDQKAELSLSSLIFSNVKITGSLIGSRKEIREMLEFSSKHNITPLCEEFDFEDFPKAFDKLENGKPVFRCVVNSTKVKQSTK